MSRIERAVKSKNRRISIGATPWFAAHVLPPAFREFRNQRPDLDIQLFDGNLSAITRRVAANKLDFALGIFDRMPGMRGVPLSILAHAGSARRRSTDSPQHQPMVRTQRRNSDLAHKGLPARTTHPQTACKDGNSLETWPDGQSAGHADRISRDGLGIAVIPSFGVIASRDRKVRITALDPLVTLEFHEISNRGRKLPAEAIEFCTFLKTYIAQRVNH